MQPPAVVVFHVPRPPEPPPLVAGRVRRLAVDITPLRASRDFRLLWTGELISQIGSQITLVALFVQVYRPDGLVGRGRR